MCVCSVIVVMALTVNAGSIEAWEETKVDGCGSSKCSESIWWMPRKGERCGRGAWKDFHNCDAKCVSVHVHTCIHACEYNETARNATGRMLLWTTNYRQLLC